MTKEWTNREDAILLCYLRRYERYVERLIHGEIGDKKYKFANKIFLKHKTVLEDRKPRDIYAHLDYLLKLVKGNFPDSTLETLKKSDVENYHRLWLNDM